MEPHEATLYTSNTTGAVWRPFKLNLEMHGATWIFKYNIFKDKTILCFIFKNVIFNLIILILIEVVYLSKVFLIKNKLKYFGQKIFFCIAL